MLYYDRIDISEGIDANKRSASKEYILFVTIGIFLNKGFKFQSSVCNCCHYVSMMSMNLNYFNIGSVDYCCIINGFSKSKATNLLENSNLSKNSGTL